MFMSLRDAERKYPIATAKIEMMYNANELKMERWYGGNLNRICKLKDQPIYLMVSHDNRTMDIAINPDDIKMNDLRALAKEHDVNADATRKKEDIIKELYTKI
jgi:hypothetical protein